LIESLILAQDERWRRGLGMQVVRSCLTIVRHSLNEKLKNKNEKLGSEEFSFQENSSQNNYLNFSFFIFNLSAERQ